MTANHSGSPRPLRVFLCHSSVDKPAVRALHQRLRAANVEPWFDEEDLLPGQDWRLEIAQRIRATDAVVVCLSAQSVAQAGFMQKEVKLALDMLDEQPEGAIFLIPARLEACELPFRLSHLHAVDLFTERGFDQLLRALQQRASAVGAATPTFAANSGSSAASSPGNAAAARPAAAPRRSGGSTDSYGRYAHGIDVLRQRLGADHPDVLLFQQRLDENTRKARRYGDTEARRSERAEIIDELNALALAELGVSFNDLCDDTATPPPVATPPPRATQPPASTALPALTELRQILTTLFNDSELRDLCFDLGIDYEGLPGQSKGDKARELILHCQRHNRYGELVAACQRLRPDAFADAEKPPAPDPPPAPAPNPFGQVGRITDPARFFGRDDLLRRVFEELRKGTSISLIGERQVGKSSLLEMIRQRGPEELGLPPEAFVLLNMQWIDDEHDFFEALCAEMNIPKQRGGGLYRALRGKRFIVCLDEIETLANTTRFDGIERQQLRGLADGPDMPLTLVIASSLPLGQLFPDTPGTSSPLANICLPLDVHAFAPPAVRAFIEERLRGTGVTFSENEIAQLIRDSSGHPAKLQQMAAAVYRGKVGP